MLIGHQPKEFLLSVEALTVSFDGFKAVNDLSFYVDENEIRVIIGPNGAGKTTVLDLICGKTKATSGSVQFRNQELTKMKENQIVQAGVGRKFDLAVRNNLFHQLRDLANLIIFGRHADVECLIVNAIAIRFEDGNIGRGDILHVNDGTPGRAVALEINLACRKSPGRQIVDDEVKSNSRRQPIGRGCPQKCRAKRVVGHWSHDLLRFGLRLSVGRHRIERRTLIEKVGAGRSVTATRGGIKKSGYAGPFGQLGEPHRRLEIHVLRETGAIISKRIVG